MLTNWGKRETLQRDAVPVGGKKKIRSFRYKY